MGKRIRASAIGPPKFYLHEDIMTNCIPLAIFSLVSFTLYRFCQDLITSDWEAMLKYLLHKFSLHETYFLRYLELLVGP